MEARCGDRAAAGRSSAERAAAGAARPGRTGGWAAPGTGAPPSPGAFGGATEWKQRWVKERDRLCPSAEEGVEGGASGEGGEGVFSLESPKKLQNQIHVSVAKDYVYKSLKSFRTTP